MAKDRYGRDFKIYTVQNLLDTFIEFPAPYEHYGGFPANKTVKRICYASFQWHLDKFVEDGKVKVVKVEDVDIAELNRDPFYYHRNHNWKNV